MSLSTIDAQTYLGKDFEDDDLNSGGFTTQMPVGTIDWYVNEYSNNKYAKMSNYNSGNRLAAESWYISPAVDLSTATSPIFSFGNSTNHSGPAMEVLMSTNYDGTSAPSSATWATLTANLSGGSYAWVNSGEIAISSTSSTTYFAFKYTGSATAGATWQVDSVFVAEAGTAFNTTVIVAPVVSVEKTITEIQSHVSSADISYYVDSTVTTSGIVTAIHFYNNVKKGYYLQDGVGAWSGVYVYDPSNTVSKGDSLTITGEVTEHNEVTQISNVSNTTVVNSQNSVSPTLIATYPTSYEEYESVLVKVVNANCTEGTDGFGNFKVDDGSGYVKVTDDLFAYTPIVGTAYDITGVMAYYLYFKLAPRDANDVSVHSTTPVSILENNAVLTNVYPNPTTNGMVTIEVKEASDLVITDILGNVVLTSSLTNNTNTINVSNLAAGNYILRVGTSVQQLIVK